MGTNLSNFTEINWSIIIAIYAGIVSTVTGIIQVIRYRKDFRNRLIVKTTLKYQFILFHNAAGDATNILDITIINDSAKVRYIERPCLKANKKTPKGKLLSVVDFTASVKYPLSLNPGETHVFTVKNKAILGAITGTQVTKIKGIVWDTLGNEYSSKFIEVRDISP